MKKLSTFDWPQALEREASYRKFQIKMAQNAYSGVVEHLGRSELNTFVAQN